MVKEQVRPLLSESPLFSMLEGDLLEQVLDKFELENFDLGQMVIQKGDQADSMYLILTGSARVLGEDFQGNEVTLATIKRGDIFGEQALLKDEKRSASIRASSDLMVAKLMKEDFTTIVESNAEVKAYLNNYMSHTGLNNFLRQFTLFSAMTAKELKTWLGYLEKSSYVDGQYIFYEGDEPDNFYIIIEGNVEVIKEKDGEEEVIATLAEGRFFGELALLTKKVRTASIRAKGNLTVCKLSKEKFDKLLSKSEKLKEKIFNVISLYNMDLAPEELGFDVVKSAPPPPPPPPIQEEEHTKKILKEPYQYAPTGLLRKIFKGRRYPFIEQYEEMDCGAACLGMICKYYEKNVSITRMRDLANVSQEGATLLSMAKAGEQLGFNTRAVRTTYENLMRSNLPAIGHWMGYHYIVIYKVEKDRILVADPAIGLKWYTREEFEEGWNGLILILDATADIENIEEKKTSLMRFVPIVLKYKVLLLEILICSILTSILGLATPIFIQTIVDEVVVHQNVTLLNTILAGMLIIAIFNILVDSLRTYLITHTGNKIELTMLTNFYKQVLALPMRFFSTRKVGDIMARFEENDKVKELLSGTTISMFIDVTMIFVYMALMFYYNAKLAILVLLAVPVFFLITYVFIPIFQRLSRESFQREANTQSHMVESLTGVQTIKSQCAEVLNRWRWEGLFVKSLKTRFRFAMVDVGADGAAEFLEDVFTIALLWYGATLVMENQMSIGQLMAFNALAGQVLGPVSKLVEQWNDIVEALISVERIGDVFDIEPETNPADDTKIYLPSNIQGHIVFDNVSFSYGEGEQMILRNVSFEALPGQMVALVGRSGSGKTTLINLLLNFFQPNSGRILVDGMDIANVNVESLRRQTGVVLQENFLFQGSVRDNIALGVPDLPFNSIVEAATLAAAHDFISALPSGYNTDVGERGSNLSGGQRQRVAIARALIKNPRILIFDEATSALDNESERAIQKNLGAIMQNRTSFAIAHRLSTVRNADLIVVLDKGLVVETGTHDELMNAKGLYYFLNSASLEL